MYSVTQRISVVKQPRGGYLHPKTFSITEFDNSEELYEEENISPILMGLVVDYLTRFSLGTSKEEAFNISLKGSAILDLFVGNGINVKNALRLLGDVNGLDDKSITSACKLVGYDVCLRAGPSGYRPVEDIQANNETINNVRIMVNRSLTFFANYGPMTADGFTFEGGYTDIVSSGDGDFLTEDTLWDFKVSKNKPTSKHTIQLLIYYLMGMKSIHKEFKSITKLGIFNPRLNSMYILDIDSIDKSIIDEVEKEVIGY